MLCPAVPPVLCCAALQVVRYPRVFVHHPARYTGPRLAYLRAYAPTKLLPQRCSLVSVLSRGDDEFAHACGRLEEEYAVFKVRGWGCGWVWWGWLRLAGVGGEGGRARNREQGGWWKGRVRASGNESGNGTHTHWGSAVIARCLLYRPLPPKLCRRPGCGSMWSR